MTPSSPSPERSDSQSFLSNGQRAAVVAVGVYSASQIYNGIGSNIKELTGSTRKQEKFNRISGVLGSLALAIPTKGASIIFPIVSAGINEALRRQTLSIENQARREERELKGQHITNGMGSVYYD